MAGEVGKYDDLMFGFWTEDTRGSKKNIRLWITIKSDQCNVANYKAYHHMTSSWRPICDN